MPLHKHLVPDGQVGHAEKLSMHSRSTSYIAEGSVESLESQNTNAGLFVP